jgi:hypothetical protein
VGGGRWEVEKEKRDEACSEYVKSSFVFVLSVPEVPLVPFAGSPVESEMLSAEGGIGDRWEVLSGR